MQSAAKQIRNLVLVFGGGVLGAFLIVYIMVAYYGPSGRYTAGNILIAPDIADGLSFPDVDPRTGKMTRYVFDRVDYLAYDELSNSWIRKPLDFKTYREIYQTIEDDKSVMEVTSSMIDTFHLETPATLTIVVRTEEESKTFQELQIAKRGDLYRILLHEESARPNWVYFSHPGIYEIVRGR